MTKLGLFLLSFFIISKVYSQCCTLTDCPVEYFCVYSDTLQDPQCHKFIGERKKWNSSLFIEDPKAFFDSLKVVSVDVAINACCNINAFVAQRALLVTLDEKSPIWVIDSNTVPINYKKYYYYTAKVDAKTGKLLLLKKRKMKRSKEL